MGSGKGTACGLDSGGVEGMRRFMGRGVSDPSSSSSSRFAYVSATYSGRSDSGPSDENIYGGARDQSNTRQRDEVLTIAEERWPWESGGSFRRQD